MCRHLAYLGPPVRFDALLYEPPHSLHRQSWMPRFQREGAINADGFGVGWYSPELRSEPARYRTATPMWADRSFRSLAGVTVSGALLAAVRSATPPSPVVETGNAPFTSGSILFSHNGAVDGFRTELGEQLRRDVSVERASKILGSSDSEVVFALVLDAIDAGASLADALAEATRHVLSRTTARLNLLATDGERIAATTWGNSLFTIVRNGAVIVASEPFDEDTAWASVDDDRLVVADHDGITISPLGQLDGPG
jgi:glutamine amidotransferase